jgi:hypothetical protein
VQSCVVCEFLNEGGPFFLIYEIEIYFYYGS